MGAVALDLRGDASAVVLEADIIFEMADIRKVDIDVLDVACVVAANSVKESGYTLRVGRDEVEVLLGVKQRAGFMLDRLVHAKEIECWFVIPHIRDQ